MIKRELHCVRADVFGDLKIMFLRRSLAHISYFFLSVHLGVLPPPPNTKKLATLVLGATFSYRQWTGGGGANYCSHTMLAPVTPVSVQTWRRAWICAWRQRHCPVICIVFYLFIRLFILLKSEQLGSEILWATAPTELKLSLRGDNADKTILTRNFIDVCIPSWDVGSCTFHFSFSFIHACL